MEVWIPVFGAAVTAFGAVWIASYTQRQTRRDVRTMIKSDIEALKLLKELHPESSGVQKLQEHIAWRIDQLAGHERGARRDWTGIVALLLLWSTAAAIALGGFYAGSWWKLAILPALLLFTLGLPGLGSFKKKIRET
ncbi:hypothetical protein [Nocardia ninae]|uniref:hypothetical protein n=1 Tax=Nocardia ninae TaxID=356145 RepID=UPI0011BE9B1E|nr:hypothetical protein [Nocardia ninae]